ncbi:MAG: HD domain-containing protein [Erysipelotrichaceae bacterium]|nr:HD domain-containing protein [Erysipelotrichaceae bacterium]
MKKIKDFVEGERIETNCLVTALTKGVTNSGAPYLSITLQDSTKSIDGKLWDVKPEIEKELKVGKVYQFEMEINTYRNNLQAKILNVCPVDEGSIDMSEFVSSSPISKDELRSTIHNAVNGLSNKNIATIVTALLKHYDADVFEYPAASKIHHNFVGGLATHTSGMIKLANALCDLYPQVNRDYLVAGAVIHDLGKIEELTSPVVTEYSVEGKLIGHISILDARLLEIGKELKLEDSEELLLLRHMVLSHHGEYEFGSPVRPETIEAEMLSFIDNIDAKINILDKALSEIKEGEFTQKIFALDNRVFYKHK